MSITISRTDEQLDRPSAEEPPKDLGLRTTALFAGIGGIELGLGRAGHTANLFCENDPGAGAVLAERFPGVEVFPDICDLKQVPPGTQLVTAGFPCQDLSQAGTTKGINGTRSSLVSHVFALLEETRVPWVLLENVSFMLRLAKGEALQFVVKELERLHYKWVYRVVDSRAFGLPQRRKRVFLLASLDDDPRPILLNDDAGEPDEPAKHSDLACGFYWTEGTRGLGWATDAIPTIKGGSAVGIPSPPAIWMPSGEIVLPDIRDAERFQGFEADWTAPAARVVKDSLRWKLVGNAVTVDVAEWIGRRLAEREELPSYDGVGFPLTRGEPWPDAAWNVGDGRFTAIHASAWPFGGGNVSLEDFLRYPPRLLSERATAGFLGRAKASTLRFPEGFLQAVEAHLNRQRAETAA